jgi:hypothetical protein
MKRGRRDGKQLNDSEMQQTASSQPALLLLLLLQSAKQSLSMSITYQ